MTYRFGPFELDAQAFELREAGTLVAVEPQVFSLLLLLVQSRDRLVSKDELIEKIWCGRIVSDAALSSRVKSTRRAIGDDGARQSWIRTVHGRGFRFIGPVIEAPAPAQAAIAPIAGSVPALASMGERPSIAVLPFRSLGRTPAHALIGQALPHEIITELCRLRWLFVTARGSSFRIGDVQDDVCEVGRLLGVGYCLSGRIEGSADQLVAAVELADTRDGALVWAERFAVRFDEVHDVRCRITSSVITALELHIPLHEAQLARLRAPDHLDAWSAYHLGLQHMYRFNRTDNDIAAAMFGKAIAIDPGFARAHAGLSFSHFQTAFMGYNNDPQPEAVAARRHAERALEIDALDPFANFTLGRSFWLRSDVESSLGWLDRAIALSPNYAQAIYARGWVESIIGDGNQAQHHVDLAMALSPLDPLHYAMLAARALAHLNLGEDGTAAKWADRAARAPGAHVLIAVIAAACHALNGDRARATFWSDAVRGRDPGVTQESFFRSFPFRNVALRERMSSALSRLAL